MHVTDSHALAKEIAALLLVENLTGDVQSLMRDVLAYRAERGLVEVQVISAYPINAQVRGDIRSVLSVEYPHAKSIRINEEIDPSVVGGLRIEAAGEQLDLTVRAKLNTLKRLTAARNA